MQIPAVTISTRARAHAPVKLAIAAAACVVFLSAALGLAPGPAGAASARKAHAAYACNGPATVPCHFSTPSGNVRCLWTPSPNNVACELLPSGRAYRLRPTGKAKAIKLNLKRRGQTLPTNQQVVFPDSLSCHDTKTTMTCNQDFGLGVFKLAPKGSRGS
jgi:hypothetical protein